MLRISKLTDYAFIVLCHMARGEAGVYAAPELASGTGIAVPTVSKILKTLVKASIVRSARGAKGGYALVRSPEQTTVAEIIGALEGPIALTDCASNENDCHQAAGCGVRGNWAALNRAVYAALSAVTLADMLRPAQAMGEVRIPVHSLSRDRVAQRS